MYSPFKFANGDHKFIDSIEYEDLKILQQVDESYSIEYKENLYKIKEEKLPKAVSAFSNSIGGWFFIGVNNAGEIKDVELNDITEEQLYSAIESRVSPMPIVDIKIIPNPTKQNYGVVVVFVHEGRNTPYIANGTIFVRNGKESKPADRSNYDLLLKKSMDYSNIELKCVDCPDNYFTIEEDKLDEIRYRVANNSVETFSNFSQAFSTSKAISLYIENNGKHYDENIELTIKLHKNNYVDILKALKQNPNENYEELLAELLRIKPKSGYEEFKFEFGDFYPRPVKMPYAKEDKQFSIEYMDYLFKSEYRFDILKEGDFYYLKVCLKEINPGQKVFLPSCILVCRTMSKIEYSITSKYSMGRVAGSLIYKESDY